MPGNFDPTESGHTSAHVMIKVRLVSPHLLIHKIYKNPSPLDSISAGLFGGNISLAMPLSVLTFGVQLHTASQRAINLWQRRDGGNLNHSTSETDLSSAVSSYAKTVVGSGVSGNSQRMSPNDHGTICRGCNKVRASQQRCIFTPH